MQEKSFLMHLGDRVYREDKQEMKMNLIHQSAMTIAAASKGNPVTATFTVILFVLGLQFISATAERLIWGERFEHWLDVVMLAASVAYAAYVVYACALYNSASGA